jgi:hypothetical protein
LNQAIRRPRFRFSTSFKAWLLSPVILLFLSACRLLLVANYDTTTAMTISSTVGAISTLLGTMIPILSAYLPALALFFAAIRNWRSALLAGFAALLISPAQKNLRETVDGMHQQVASLLSGLETDGLAHLLTRGDLAWITAFAVAWTGIGMALRQYPPSGYAFYFIEPEDETAQQDDAAPPAVTLADFGKQALVLALFLTGIAGFMFVQNAYSMTFSLAHLSQTVRLPWLPPEEITVEEEERKTTKQVAYVLSVSGEWTVLLDEEHRTISYVPSSQVKARKVCELPATSTAHDPPVIKLEGAERPDLEDCGLQEST